jgi:hypothetical protein
MCFWDLIYDSPQIYMTVSNQLNIAVSHANTPPLPATQDFINT